MTNPYNLSLKHQYSSNAMLQSVAFRTQPLIPPGLSSVLVLASAPLYLFCVAHPYYVLAVESDATLTLQGQVLPWEVLMSI